MTLFFAENEKDIAEAFLSSYELQNMLICPDQKPKNLKLKKDRVCRFCGLAYPLASFKKIAHIIPELLGNRHLLSDFECDNCNEKLGIYEGDLANFLGISRTINGIHSKKGIPKFKSFKDKLTAANENFQTSEGGSIFIAKKAELEHMLSIDAEKGTLVVNYDTNPYGPRKVYKALLKMALSCLSADEIVYYSHSIKYLMSRDLDDKLTGANSIFSYTMTLGINYTRPMAFLFKKRNPDDQMFTHWFMLYFSLQIIILVFKRYPSRLSKLVIVSLLNSVDVISKPKYLIYFF